MIRIHGAVLAISLLATTADAEPTLAVGVGAAISAPFPTAGLDLQAGYRVSPRWWWFAGAAAGPTEAFPADTYSPGGRAIELRTGPTWIRRCGARGCTGFSLELGVSRFRVEYADGVITPSEWLEQTTLAFVDVRYRAEWHLVGRGRLGLQFSVGLRGMVLVANHSEPAMQFDGNQVGNLSPGAVIGLALIGRR